MPITIKASEGLLTPQAEQQIFQKVTDAFLAHNGVKGNSFITPNMIGDVITVPHGKSYAGGVPTRLIEVQLKVPSFSLETQEQRERFCAEATDIIYDATTKPFDKKLIYINLVYGSGMWSIGGKAYTNDSLIASIEAAV